MSQSRKKISEEFEIDFPVEQLPLPPCQPPKGKAVLERFYAHLRDQPSNSKNATTAAYDTAKDLEKVWSLGDARIPRLHITSIQNNIVAFHQQLKLLNTKSKAKQPKYIKAVC